MIDAQEKFNIIGKKLYGARIIALNFNPEYNRMILTCLKDENEFLTNGERFFYQSDNPLEFAKFNSSCITTPPKQMKIDEEIKMWATLEPGLSVKCPKCKKKLSFNAMQRYVERTK